MHISNLVEVDEDIFQATIEHEDGSVIVTMFHGRDSIREFLMRGFDGSDSTNSEVGARSRESYLSTYGTRH